MQIEELRKLAERVKYEYGSGACYGSATAYEDLVALAQAVIAALEMRKNWPTTSWASQGPADAFDLAIAKIGGGA